MGKVTNIALAEFISKRISEILDLTSFTLSGLANFSKIPESQIRSYYNKRLVISVESLAKICDSLAIDMADFFNTTKGLTIAKDPHSAFNLFKAKFFQSGQKFFIDEPENRTPISMASQAEHRYQRESIDHLIFNSNYFSEYLTIEQIIAIFKRDYNVNIEPNRVSLLLRKYVVQDYLEKKVLPRDFSRSRQYTYRRTAKAQESKSKEEVSIIEITKVLNR